MTEVLKGLGQGMAQRLWDLRHVVRRRHSVGFRTVRSALLMEGEFSLILVSPRSYLIPLSADS
jgi:hypothetical protein